MPLLRGTLDSLVLKTLSWTPMHAFEIASWIEERSGGRVVIDDAALLQALRRLEGKKLVSAEWGVTGKARRARYYRLTSAGRAFLRGEAAELADHLDALLAVLSAKRA